MVYGFVTCGPNEAVIISGCCHSEPLIITGGCTFVLPALHRVDRLSLNLMTLIIESKHIYTKLGVPINVIGVAQVKIPGSNRQMLTTACEQFLGMDEQEIRNIAHQTLEGHQRAIIGNMTVEEIFRDRKQFSEHVFKVASTDLFNMGVCVISYTLKDISDDEGYLSSLGLARIARVKCDARIGEAEAKKQASIRQSEAEQDRIAVQRTNEILVAKASRDFEVRKAEVAVEVQTCQAVAELAYKLQAAKIHQQIKEQEIQIDVVERCRRIELEELEVLRMEQQLISRVRKPADAERFRVECLAEAEKAVTAGLAETEGEAIKLCGFAEAETAKTRSKADADSMLWKSDAWGQYQSAAKLDMVLKALPRLANELAEPLKKCKKITMVSSGDGEVGVGKFIEELLSSIERLPKLVQNMTGLNVQETLQVM